MFRNLAVCTVVLVAVLSNDALALHQGNSYTPVTNGGPMDDTKETMDGITSPIAITPTSPISTTPSVLTTPGVSSPTTGTKPLTEGPSVKTPTKEKGLHESDCIPNFPSAMPKEALKAKPAAMPVLVTPPAPMPVVVTPLASKPMVPSVVTPVQPLSTPAGEANNEQTGQKANTQSGTQSVGATAGTSAIVVVGLIAAVAAVGVAVSQVKKARDADADAALVTPGENENIHIEIKNTPAGGSTIL